MASTAAPVPRHSPPAVVGQLHDHYELLEQVGEGAMGTVFRALDTKLQREVAVKFLDLGKFEATDDVREELRRRFMREARLLARLSHPHLVQVYAAVFDVTQPFFVMEYLSGPTLEHRIELRPCLRYAEICELAMQIVDALWFAWQTQHVIHCDLKPSNILFADHETVKIADMGIAQVIGPQGGPSSRDRLALGTLAYMAPEQHVGGCTLDHRVDLYALGVILVELFSFRLPFDGDDSAVILAAKQRGLTLHLERYARGLPSALTDLAYGLLEPDPARRRSSHGDILDVLDSALTELRQRPAVSVPHTPSAAPNTESAAIPLPPIHSTIRIEPAPPAPVTPSHVPPAPPLPPATPQRASSDPARARRTRRGTKPT